MEELCLNWTNYQNSVSSVFQNLRDSEQFTDVTISTKEGISFKAHRVVLCAASTYFRDLLSATNSWQHPIVILKDLPDRDIEYLLEFIYTGTVSILPENLTSLLQTAKFLAITGLTETTSAEKVNITHSPNNKKRKLVTTENTTKHRKEQNGNHTKGQQNDLQVKIEPLDIGPEELSSSYARGKHFEDNISTEASEENIITPEQNTFESPADITNNIFEDNRDNPGPTAECETPTESGPLTCLVCRATLSNCNALYYHMNYVHSGGVEPGDIIRNIGTVMGATGEGVKTEERD